MVDIRLTRVAKKAADFLDLDLVELCEINKHADLNSQNVEIILVRLFGTILSLIIIIPSLVILAGSNGTSSTCHDCHFISCVPFPF